MRVGPARWRRGSDRILATVGAVIPAIRHAPAGWLAQSHAYTPVRHTRTSAEQKFYEMRECSPARMRNETSTVVAVAPIRRQQRVATVVIFADVASRFRNCPALPGPGCAIHQRVRLPGMPSTPTVWHHSAPNREATRDASVIG